MTDSVALFGGTSEGRELAEYCEKLHLPCHVFVATAMGERFLSGNVRTHTGRLSADAMIKELSLIRPKCVYDATHPYATEVSENIRKACGALGLPYRRILRSESKVAGDYWAETPKEAARILSDTFPSCPVLIATGSKELPFFSEVAQKNPSVYVRLLPGKENEEAALQAGIRKEHIITGVGPFTQEENEAVLLKNGIRALVTKESGSRGGYEEKIRAARACQTKTIVIRRPEREEGISMEEAKKELSSAKEVAIVGIGMGDAQSMTEAAIEMLSEAGLVIGAGRWMEALKDRMKEACRKVVLYHPDDVAKEVAEADEQKIVILVSGDSGFYSGAAGYRKALPDGVSVCLFPGISSVSYLCAKAGVMYSDAAVFSIHGRKQNIYGALAGGRTTILLGGEGFEEILEGLCYLGYKELPAVIGQRLGTKEEAIRFGTVASLRGKADEALSLLMLMPAGREIRRRSFGIEDDAFVRGAVPMTKSEVRAVCMSRLAIGETDTVYDVGAGTGSISVEAAIAACRGKVYAVECQAEARDLIKKNAQRFLCSNIEVVEGRAPEALKQLPPPDAVMIGGSRGALKSIIEQVLEKNAQARITMTAITLETLREAFEAADACALEAECVQIGVTRIAAAGKHMMKAENPVWVISLMPRKES